MKMFFVTGTLATLLLLHFDFFSHFLHKLFSFLKTCNIFLNWLSFFAVAVVVVVMCMRDEKAMPEYSMKGYMYSWKLHPVVAKDILY